MQMPKFSTNLTWTLSIATQYLLLHSIPLSINMRCMPKNIYDFTNHHHIQVGETLQKVEKRSRHKDFLNYCKFRREFCIFGRQQDIRRHQIGV